MTVKSQTYIYYADIVLFYYSTRHGEGALCITFKYKNPATRQCLLRPISKLNSVSEINKKVQTPMAFF